MSGSGSSSVSSVSISSEGKKEEVSQGLDNPNVVTKFKVAGDIANRVLDEVVALCVPGANIVEICNAGDARITEELEKVYNSKKTKCEKGIAWPTSISVNNCLGHFSPLASESNDTLKEGDLAKIDLGCHVDGFPCVVATSVVVGGEATGRTADVIAAAHNAAEVAVRMLKPGNTNHQVTEAIGKVATEFGVNPMEGVLCHEMKRFIVDGSNTILNKTTAEQVVEEVKFEAGQVWAIDILMSTGEGKSKQQDSRTTIYKRAVDQSYSLKMKASRVAFSEINLRFPTMPFTLRALSDEKRGRMGIVEMVTHDLVYPYPVLYEADGVQVAQVKFTAMILPSGNISRLSERPLTAKSDKTIQDADLKATLERSLAPKKKKNNKKKKAAKK